MNTTAPQPGRPDDVAPDTPGPHELSDEEFGHWAVLGATVGVVVTYVVLVLTVVVITGIGASAPAMAWAALVGGGFFGGSVAIALALDRAERRTRAQSRRDQAEAPAGRRAA